jgi:hypothetical protein
MNAIQSLTNNLASYLRTEVAGLTVKTEWPGANEKLQYPSLTIFAGEPIFTPFQPTEISRTAPDVNNKVISTMSVGEYDLTMQLDIWCRNKLERETVFGQVFDAINKTVVPMGLSLQLTDYFNEWARYDIDRHSFVDDEAGAQRQEWRVKLSLLANVKCLKQVTTYAMITIVDTVGVTTDTITS